MSDTKRKPKRKRRWLSYSLRTLLVVTTIFCVALGYWVHRANRQRDVVKWVEENGRQVHYDFEFDEDGVPIDDAKPPGPKWVRDFLGDDYLATVVEVYLHDSEVKDIAPLAKLKHLEALNLSATQVSDLTPLVGLTRLEFLSLGYTQVSDLTPLEGMTRLEWLNLSATQVSDLTPLEGMTRLEFLCLYYTQATQEQIDALQKALPNCEIEWSSPYKAGEGN